MYTHSNTHSHIGTLLTNTHMLSHTLTHSHIYACTLTLVHTHCPCTILRPLADAVLTAQRPLPLSLCAPHSLPELQFTELAHSMLQALGFPPALDAPLLVLHVPIILHSSPISEPDLPAWFSQVPCFKLVLSFHIRRRFPNPAPARLSCFSPLQLCDQDPAGSSTSSLLKEMKGFRYHRHKDHSKRK